MPKKIVLSNKSLQLEVVPEIGAGIANLSYLVYDNWINVLRKTEITENTQALDLASVLMIPWCGRIFNGGFTHSNQFIKFEPNLPNIPFPIHGNALTSIWNIVKSEAEKLDLELISNEIMGFNYLAKVSYTIDNESLTINMEVTNLNDKAMLYGFGLHPWFVRTPNTKLKAKAKNYCEIDPDERPLTWQDVKDKPKWNFQDINSLPGEFIDNSFTNWDGIAHIQEDNYVIDIQVGKLLANNYHLFSPHKDCGFFCFEPMSHLINEHNIKNPKQAPGLVNLQKNASISSYIKFTFKTT